MKIVIQRVNSASILIDNSITRSIRKGIIVYFGISKEDTIEKIDYFVNKLKTLRIWSEEETHNGCKNEDRVKVSGKGFQKNILDIKGEILLVSQFTLYGDCTKGTKPKFNDAMKPGEAKKIYDLFVEKVRELGLKVETGEFGSHMEITQVNDGPVTLIIEK